MSRRLRPMRTRVAETRRLHLYHDRMSPRPRSLTQRIRDTLGFSVVAILVLFILLRLVGVRSTIPSLFLSIIITIGLNVGLSYYYDHRARSGRASSRRDDHVDEDIRWRRADPDDRDRRGRDERDRQPFDGRDHHHPGRRDRDRRFSDGRDRHPRDDRDRPREYDPRRPEWTGTDHENSRVGRRDDRRDTRG